MIEFINAFWVLITIVGSLSIYFVRWIIRVDALLKSVKRQQKIIDDLEEISSKLQAITSKTEYLHESKDRLEKTNNEQWESIRDTNKRIDKILDP